MPRRETEQAAAQAAPLEAASLAVGAGTPAGAGTGARDPISGDLRRAGLIPFLVLDLLGAGPSYGNRLIEEIETLSGGLLAVNPNTMYPLLRSLEHRGLVLAEWEHPERRSRRFYRLTPTGEEERERLRADVAPHLARVADAVGRLQERVGAGA